MQTTLMNGTGRGQQRSYRDRGKERRWRRVVAAYEASGCPSARQFCASNGINENLFYWWRKTIQRRDKLKSDLVERPLKDGNPFVPICIVSEQPEQVVEISLPGGAAVSMRHETNVVLVAKLLKALAVQKC